MKKTNKRSGATSTKSRILAPMSKAPTIATAKAAYGKQILVTPSRELTAKFGKGFDERNLWHMCRFYRAFPILNAVSTESSWSHFIEQEAEGRLDDLLKGTA